MWSRSHWENKGVEKCWRDDGKTIGGADAFENHHVIHHCKKIYKHIHIGTHAQKYRYITNFCTTTRAHENPSTR